MTPPTLLLAPLGLLALLGALLLAPPLSAQAPPKAANEEASAFVKKLNEELKPMVIKASTADWIKNTYITDDTEQNAAWANEQLMAYMGRSIKESIRFAPLKLDGDASRMLYLLRPATSPPPPPYAPRNPLTL